MTPAQVKRARELYHFRKGPKTGPTLHEIAAMFDVSHVTIFNAIYGLRAYEPKEKKSNG